MKAKIFTKGKKNQIFLSNGDVHTSKRGESKSDFTKRIKGVVENDLLDTLELKEVTVKSLKSLTTKSIEKTYPTAQGLFQEFLGEVLSSRGVELPEDEVKKTPQKAEAPKKEKKAAAPKKEKTLDERQVAIAEFKNSKDYVAAVKNVGKEVTYSVRATKKAQKGTIKGLSINKKLTKFYYTVLDAKSKKRVCVAVQNITF